MSRDPMARAFAGRLALVTGAGSGIGRALALQLAEAGATVVMAGRRLAALAETRDLSSVPQRLVPVAADITTADGRAALARWFIDRRCALDLLVNNAGMVLTANLAGTDDDRLNRLMAVNVVAPLALTRDLLPFLSRGARPRVVMVGSMFGDIAFPLFAAYSASKFALRGAADALRRELAPLGIGVTYAAPRATRTPAAAGFADLVDPLAMTLDEPDAVAAAVLRAAARGARSAYPRGPERLFVLVQRLLPALIDRAVVKQTAPLTMSVSRSVESQAASLE